MSVRRVRKISKKTGRVMESWSVDISIKPPDGIGKPIRFKKAGLENKAEAVALADNVRRSILSGTWGKEKVRAPTLAEFAETFLIHASNNNKPATLAAKRLVMKNHLVPAFGSTPLDQITRASIERFKVEQEKEGLARKTINNHVGFLRKLLNLAHKDHVLAQVPEVEAFPERKAWDVEFDYLRRDELDRFIAATPPEWLALILTALKTGLRSGELRALKWLDVDLSGTTEDPGGKLVVRTSRWRNTEGTPKSGSNRVVPISKELVATLKAHRHLRGAYVFCREDGSPHSAKDVANLVPRICKKAGLSKRLTLHDLRHSFATHLVEKRVPIRTVQELLGHSTILMTTRYAHVAPDMKREAVDLLDSSPGVALNGVARTAT